MAVPGAVSKCGAGHTLKAMSANQQTWFGQPRGLAILFLTEMWEIFSYYGMRTLLVYYMTKQLLIGQERASLIYGVYLATLYFTPIFGGLIADRWLGKRHAVIIGGGIMAAGHFMMTFEPLFYLALATIAFGNGLFLPSLPSQIDGLYRADDPRRGWAYNVYYVGINVGGFLAPLVCGVLGEVYGWHWGFGAAGVGMLLGLVIYILGGKYLPEQVRASKQTLAPTTLKAPAGRYRSTFVLLFAVGLAVTVFRGAYEQYGNTLALWADVGIDRTIGPWTIPMTWFPSLDPLLVIMMTPLLLAHWSRRAQAGYALFYAVFTLGELYILPTGLGLFARLAPIGYGATTVAAWFLVISSGALSSGIVGTLWGRISHAGFFAILTVISAIAAAMLFALDPAIRRIEAARAAEIIALNATQPEPEPA
jgi:proton-dependent oligopeptide transporter, POT family